ncbi:cobalt-precorrin 5A hydrolase [Alkaliphilus hydrothermalis]|uniref:cobalt-precorrin 5A hydrolase n=1 Tax=Alkaliphilus hydrothermalis TaxID=1482730 RepID=UPI001958A29A|nr:cobalt-precorrin 5A hydrolase [Alkaliphilus hydrothermalis]
MRYSIFALTMGATELGLRLKQHLPEAILYSKPAFAQITKQAGQTTGIIPIEVPLKELVQDEFKASDLMIFIMATGIVVRMIAPHLQHKGKDPGILVMDEDGRNIISLLSGHLGGANEWTRRLATLLEANPVITTASDVRGLLSVDLFAEENNCGFEDWEGAKKVTAHLINGGTVGVFSEVTLKTLPQGYEQVSRRNELMEYAFGIVVAHERTNNQKDINIIVQLFPKNIVVGIGCRRDTPTDVILEEIQHTFQDQNLSTSSIVKFVTVDVKQDEVGLQEVAQSFKVPLEVIQRQRIKEVEEQFETSVFVRKTIGVGAVSGPCAYLGSNRGRLILEKRKNRGITLSIAEMVIECNKG